MVSLSDAHAATVAQDRVPRLTVGRHRADHRGDPRPEQHRGRLPALLPQRDLGRRRRRGDAETWAARIHPEGLTTPPDGDLIAIGFDGARFHDSTGLIGVRLEDSHEFHIATWEKPPETDDDDWEVPGVDVNEAMEMTFDRWKVSLAYCDPPYWEDEVDRWAGAFGPVKKWWTNRQRPMAHCVRAFDQKLAAGARPTTATRRWPPTTSTRRSARP